MPPWLIHGTAVAVRVLAGLIGFVCFYVVLFQYEDEDGAWQNRLDDIWIAANDKAKLADSTATALFNRIGDSLRHIFRVLFGPKVISARLVYASVFLSLATMSLLKSLDFNVVGFFMHNYFLDLASVETRAKGFWYGLLFGWLILKYPNKWTHTICFMLLAIMLLSDPVSAIIGSDHITVFTFASFIAYGLSAISDVASIVIIRRIFKEMSKTLSFWDLLKMLGTLVFLASSLYYLPLIGFLPEFRSKAAPYLVFEITLTELNALTVALCLLPMLMLCLVILNRAFWPAFSRLYYPLCRYKIISNKKLLSASGALCLTFALDVGHVGIKDILKLFSQNRPSDLYSIPYAQGAGMRGYATTASDK